uniref:Chromatin binding protein n=1 Tax=Solanum tuberosum TaxID=4113 RepID=M1CBZ1_SOLTU
MVSAYCENQLNSNIKLKNSTVQFFWLRFGASRVTWIEETPIMLMYYLVSLYLVLV